MILDMVKEGKDLKDMIEVVPNLIYRNFGNLEKLRDLYQKHREASDPPQCILYWGDSESGKTRAAVELADSEGVDYYIKSTGKWWDGYSQQHTVIIDEMNSKFFGLTQGESLAMLQKLLDRYRLSVEIKGGYMKFNSPRIIVTSNSPIEEWFPELYAQNAQWLVSIKRRFHIVKHFTVSPFNPATARRRIDPNVENVAPQAVADRGNTSARDAADGAREALRDLTNPLAFL